MTRFMRRITKNDAEMGASAVEYGLLIVAIAAVIVVIIFALGGVVQGLFSKTCSTVSENASAGGDCST